MIRFLSKISSPQLQGTALLRLDFNTEDEWRMDATLPTVRFLLKYAEKIVIVSHRGRPNGPEDQFSLKKDAVELGKKLGREIVFVPHHRFGEIRAQVKNAPKGSVFLLENLRFLEGEGANDKMLARELASLADYYVNDAFAVSHRRAASVVAITNSLPSYAGLELEEEIKHLSRVLTAPEHPTVFVLGGAKVHGKLGLIQYFKGIADCFLIGGAAANTLLYLKGIDVRASVKDENEEDLEEMRRTLSYKNVVLPTDYAWKGEKILDVGERTIGDFTARIARARTIVWTGAMGYIEEERFEKGTLAVARAIAGNRDAFSVIGGGETVMFLKKHELDKQFSFISTGGGALLDYLADNKLVGIDALEKAAERT